MKKALPVLMAFILIGCTPETPETPADPGPDTDGQTEVNMELEMKQYTDSGRIWLTWGKPENAAISKITVENDQDEPLYTAQTYSETLAGDEMIAYACQENDYYGPIHFRITIPDNDTGKILQEYVSETLTGSDWFPAEEEIDINGRQLRTFSWSRTRATSYVETLTDTLDDFSLYVSSKNIATLYINRYDSTGELKEYEFDLTDDELTQFTDLIKNGRLVRMRIDDPEMIELDGPSWEKTRAEFENAGVLEKRWFEFHLSDTEKQALLDWVSAFCK